AGRVTTFDGVENLVGGTQADNFQFQNGGTLTNGLIDGGTGAGDRLQGDLNGNSFVISGTNAGTYDDGGPTSGLVSFTDVESLDGRSGVDQFTFTAAGILDGQLQGGAGLDELIASDNGDFFHVTSPNAGILYDTDIATNDPRTVGGFVSIESLTGGIGNDTFDVDADLTGDLLGGGGDDIFLVDGNVGGDLDGGAGSNLLTLGAGASIAGNVSNVTVTLDINAPAADTIPDEIELRLNSSTGALEAIINGTLSSFFVPNGLDLTINVTPSTDDLFLTIDNENGGLINGTINYDGGTGDDDLRVIGSGSPSEIAQYNADLTANAAGSILITDATFGRSQTVTFDDAGPVDIWNLTALTFVTPQSNDVVTLTAGADAHQGVQSALVISGSSGGTMFQPVHLRDITSLELDLAANDGVNADDQVTVNDGSLVANQALAELTISTGEGVDTFDIQEDDYTLPGLPPTPTVSNLPIISISDVSANEGDGTLFDANPTSIIFPSVSFIDEIHSGSFDILNNSSETALDLLAVDDFRLPGVLLSDGVNEAFNVGSSVPTGTISLQVAVGDIDDDDDDDVVVLDESSNQIRVFVNTDGAGTFVEQAFNVNVGFFANEIGLADIDGNNNLDIVLIDSFNAIVDVYLSNSNFGTFSTSPVRSAIPAGTQEFVFADVDGDLQTDIVTISNNTTISVTPNRGDGSGSFDNSRFVTTGVVLSQLNVANLNEGQPTDAGLEIFALDRGVIFSPIVILENLGGGSFSSTSLPTGTLFPTSMATGRIDSNGSVDIVLGGGSPGQELTVLLGNGDLTFQAGQGIAAPGFVDGDFVEVGDFNGDGLDDVALVDRSSGGAVFYNAGVPDAVVTLSLSTPDLNNPVTVDVTLADGLALGGVDYDSTMIPPVVFAPGQTTVQISIPMIGDTLVEGDENFFLNLSNATNAVIGDSQGQVTIIEDDGGLAGPTVEIVDRLVTASEEGDTGTSLVDITVQLIGGPAATDITVDYSFLDQTARAGFDYVATSGSVQIAAGSNLVTFPIQIIGDLNNEVDETFLINIAQSTPGEFGVISRSQATVTISANDTNIPILGGGLTFDGGAGQDVLRVTSDAELIELDATPGASEVRLGTTGSSGAQGTLNLDNLAGEVLFVTGGAGDNTIDLSLWTSNSAGTIDGLGGSDTLVGPTAAQITWDVTGAAAGAVENFAYSNVENLQGTAGSDDRFIFDPSITVAGSISGGLGGNDQINYSSFGAPVNVILTGANGTGTETASITNGFAGIEDFIGTGGGDSFTGRDVDSTWTIGAAGSTYSDGGAITFRDFASINGGAADDDFSIQSDVTLDVSTGDGANSVTVSNDRTLTGGITGGADSDVVILNTGAAVTGSITTADGNDTLQLADGADVSGSFDAGAGDDTLSFMGYQTARDIAITAVNGTDGFDGTEVAITGGFTSVNSLIGSASASDALQGLTATAAVWTIDTIGSYNAGGELLAISSIENLTGSSADDRFQFGSFGLGLVPQVTVSAGSGNDQLVANVNGSDFLVTAADAGTVTVRNSAAIPATAVSQFFSVESLVGNSGNDRFEFLNSGSLTGSIDGNIGDDTLVGDSDGNIFTVTAEDAGTLAGKVTNGFVEIENLAGGLASDTFNVNADLNGGITGFAGEDVVVVADGVTIAGAIDTGSAADQLTFGNNTVVGGVVTGGGAADTLTILGAITATIGGGADNDVFVLGTAASVTGTLDGGIGVDEIQASDNATVFVINAIDAGSVIGQVDAFTSVENLTGGDGDDVFQFETAGRLTAGVVDGGAGTDTLDGDLNSNDFVISGTDTGTYDSDQASGGEVVFVNVESLDGRSGNDRFRFTTLGILNDTLHGGAGLDELIASNNGDFFHVTATNAGTLYDGPGMLDPRTVNGFLSVENLTGGDGEDTFDIDADVFGNLLGGDGNDTFTVDGDIGGDLDGGDGNNTLTLGAGASIAGTVSNVSVTQTVGAPEDGSPDVIELRLNGSTGALEAVVNGVVNPFFVPTNLDLTILVPATTDDVFLTVNNSNGGLIDADIVFSGGAGDDDLSVIGSGSPAENAVYTPNVALNAAGLVELENSSIGITQTITFEDAGPLDFANVARLTFVTPESNDVVDLDAGLDAHFNTQNALVISGSSGGTPFAAAHIRSTISVEVDLATNDGVLPDDVVSINDGSLQANSDLAELSISTGNGTDTFNVSEDDYLLPGAAAAVAPTSTLPELTIADVTTREGDPTTFGSPTNVAGVGGFIPQDMVELDFDGDNDLDLATIDRFNGFVTILVNTGNGNFVTATTGAISTLNATQLAAGDFNDDGRDDLAIFDQFNDTFEVLRSFTFLQDTPLFIQTTFQTITYPSAGFFPSFSAAEVADIDNDGDVDIVLSNNDFGFGFNGGHITVIRNSLELGFGFGGSVFQTNGEAYGTFSVGADDLVLDDFNLDGSPDVVVISDTIRTGFTFMPNTGVGAFTANSFVSSVNGLRAVTSGDVNGDGRPDVILLSANSVLVFENLGGTVPVFSAGAVIATNEFNGADVVAADFNDDGNIDFAVTDGSDSDDILVSFGNGAGAFGAVQRFATGNTFSNQGVTLIAADFNNDGLVDLAQYSDDVGLNGVVTILPNTSAATAMITVSLSAVATQPVTVDYSLTRGTAVPTGDFDGTPGTITIPVGQSSATIAVSISGDLNVEPDENFFVNLSNPVNAVITDLQGQVTILDDDGAGAAGPRIDVGTAFTFTEGDSGVTTVSVPLTLSAAVGTDVTVDFVTRAITAQAGVDYIDTAGTATFTAGSTTANISIDIVGDLVNEGAETFLINLLDSVDVVLANTQSVVTIDVSDANVPVFNNGLRLDGGIGTDRIVVTADVGLIELDATPGAEQIRLGTIGVAGSLGRANLFNLAGEDVTVLGGAADNIIDLSLWSNGARATVDGRGGDDTFVGLDVDSDWTISGTNAGLVGDFNFSDVENLVGGAADDNFIFNGGLVTGSVDGGSGGVNTLTVGNTENAWTFERIDGGSVRLGPIVTDPLLSFDNLQLVNGGTAADTFTFDGGTIESLSGGTGEDAIQGDNLANTWNVRDVNGDFLTVDEGTLTSSLGITVFSGIENLVGGDVVDTFVYDRDSRISRTIDGGDGAANILELSGYVTSLTTTLTSTGSTTGFAGTTLGTFNPVGDSFDNITAINFSTQNATVGDNLIGLDLTAQWNFGASRYTTAGRTLDFTLGATDDVTGGSSTDTFSFVGASAPAIRNVDGAGGADTITGDNVATSWTINGSNAGSFLPGLAAIGEFSSVENVVGGSAVDTFTFTNSGRLDGSIDGGAGLDVIVGDADGVQITITAGLSDSGVILEQDGATVKVVNGFSSVENLTGAGAADVFVINGTLGGSVDAGGGNDSITFDNAGSVAGVINGGFGFDILSGDDNANAFVISGANSGTLTGKFSSFLNVETLSGAGGDDSFTFTDAGNVNGLIIGGTGTDSIIGDEDGNIFAVSGNDAGVLFGKTSSFSEIENLFGGAAADSFSVTGSLTGSIDGRADDDIFSILAATTVDGTVTGGSGEDLFTITGTVVGQVLGGLGNDTFNLNAGANIFAGASGIVAGLNGVDGGAGNDTFNVNGVLTATLDGGADIDTILGPNGATITITGPGQGTITPGPSGGFFNMDSIQGSDGAETIIISGDFGGDFDAGGGDDIITIVSGGAVNDLNAGAGNDTVVVEDGAVVNGNINLGDGNDTLDIADEATFDGVINGGAGDDVVTIDFTTSTPGQPRTITFNGDTGNDDLVLTGGGVMTTVDYTVGPNADEGTIVTDLDGNAGTTGDRQTITFTGLEPVEDTQLAATLTINGSASNDTINVIDGPGGLNEVNFNGAFELVRFMNKTTVEVNGLGGADTVNLTYITATFTTLNVNAGAGNDTVNVQVDHLGNIDGGDDSDQIILSDGVTVSGTVGGGSGTDTLSYAAFTTDVAVNLQTGTATTIGGGISGFESLAGGQGSDSLTAVDDPNAVNITGANAGNIDTTFSFSSVENLVGGSDNDSFNFSNGASVAGTVDGGSGGTDTLNYGAYTTAVSVNLETSAATATAINGGMMNGFTNIDSIAGGSAADSITGPNADQTWTITGSEAGNVASTDFSEFEALVGGSLNDTFNFNNGVALDFSINGGAQTGADIVSFAASTVAVSVDLSLLSNIETLNDSGVANDSLVGTTGNDIFDVTGANNGTFNTTLAFTGWENLAGADGDDQFLFGNATSSINGDVDGQGGTDTLSYAGNPAAANVTLTGIGTSGYGGVETGLTSLNAFSNIDSLVATSNGNDFIGGLNLASTWVVTDSAGTTTGSYAATGGSTLSLTSFEDHSGGSAADAFNVSSTPTANLSGQGGDDSFNFATDAVLTGTIFGGMDDDTLSFAASTTDVTVSLTTVNAGDGGFDGTTGLASGGFRSINNVAGGDGDDTLNGLASAAGVWTVDTTSTYVSTNTLEFSGIDNLTGSS
ncbi:MAG: Calx-beta domain-containing protein, partial [Planctomycetales bacterium]